MSRDVACLHRHVYGIGFLVDGHAVSPDRVEVLVQGRPDTLSLRVLLDALQVDSLSQLRRIVEATRAHEVPHGWYFLFETEQELALVRSLLRRRIATEARVIARRTAARLLDRLEDLGRPQPLPVPGWDASGREDASERLAARCPDCGAEPGFPHMQRGVGASCGGYPIVDTPDGLRFRV